MAHIHVRKTHSASLDEAQRAANRIAQKIAETYAVEYYWETDILYFKRHGVAGTIVVSHTEIELKIRLSTLYSLFKSQIEEEVSHQLDVLFEE